MSRSHSLRNSIPGLLTGIIVGSSVGTVSASGFRLADQDAFATARGEAFVATADNASAIYYNPAGIAQLQGSNVRGGIYGIYLNPSYRPPAGGRTYYDQDNLAAVPQFFYTYTPEELPISFGLGVYSPYGGDMSWPQDTGFRSVATKGSLTYFTINPVVAIKPLNSLSLGAGLMVNYANMDLEQGLLANANVPNFYDFKADGWMVGYNLGVLWQPIEQLSFGLTFRSSSRFTLRGDTEFEQLPIIHYTTLPAHADFTFPLTLAGGVSYRPTPKWNVEFDTDFTDWSSFGSTIIYQEGHAPFGVKQDVPVNLYWQASWMFELGATRYFANGWHASAGYVFSEYSVPNAYYTPLAADMDRHFFSVGAGHKGKRFDFDVAYQLGYGPPHTVNGSQPASTPGYFANQSADGTYDFISHAVLVTIGMHF